MPFEKRWLIEGVLTTITPLRIGNGGITHHPDLKQRDKEGKKTHNPIEISACTTDYEDRAYIPGTSIKGRLRAWAKANSIPGFEALFGSEDTKAQNAVGGKAEFWDALAVDEPSFDHPPPYWRLSRLTGVTASVSINRRTRTASEKRLFHQEFVPLGIHFGVRVSGDFGDSEVEDLLFVLSGFNDPTQRITLGASTGDGWGQVEWELTGIRRLRAADIPIWLSLGENTAGYAALTAVTTDELDAFKARSNVRAITAQSHAFITLNVRLEFNSHFLVNDTSQTGTAKEEKPSHAPLLNTQGQVLLPGSSFRGAIRSQAEKILRTIGNEQAACYLDNVGSMKKCDDVYEVEEIAQLCLACRLFGAPGWRAPVEISDFIQIAPIRPEQDSTQEFVAIDRFTGGGAESLKFNARAVYRPTLTGIIKIDLMALEYAQTERWPLGLLVLTLRDLIEGDIHLGFGAAKGYGAARASIDSFELPAWDNCPPVFKKDLDVDQWQVLRSGGPLDDYLKVVMQDWIEELHQAIKSEGAEQ